MKTEQISKSVYYIGVNDRTTHKFEAMWPLPFGVSYNSYLVRGSEKSAVIDGVELSHALQQVDEIKAILGDCAPDYLVINHMEPDHSGAVRILRQAFPDIKIVGNALTIGMVKGFYGIEDGTMTVADGDTLSLGDATLRFVLTPMVHWPETMMTVLEEERALFAGDAFGCFGALNGAVVDADMDTARYFPEMVRYYSNIVGKYGAFVQRAFARLKGTEVETICSTHGPVWREQAAKVMELYNSLSSYEPLDNGVTVVYGSMYGNTEAMAEAVAEGLAQAGVRAIAMHNVACSDLSFILADLFRHRGLVIAAPTYSDSIFPPVGQFMDAMALRGVKNRLIAVTGSHTWAPKATRMLADFAAMPGNELVADAIALKQAPTKELLEAARGMGRTLGERLLKA